MTSVFEAETTVQKWDDDYYTPISEWLYDTAVYDMLKIMEVPMHETVLDAGCGPGVHSIRAARAGYKVRAIDISHTMLEHAHDRVEKAGFSDKVQFQQMDLTKLALQDASIGYGFSWGVIIHIREAENAFRELSRIIRPGGRLGLYLTNRAALDHKIERIARMALKKPLQAFRGPLGDGYSYRMNGEDLWVWQFESGALVKFLGELGFKLKSRRCGEFSEAQRRFSGPVRNLLLRANNLAYAANAPASLAVSNLYVFERH
jgi:ubiquinone/menaquinone biosynthesis C-methylase UbiE